MSGIYQRTRSNDKKMTTFKSPVISSNVTGNKNHSKKKSNKGQRKKVSNKKQRLKLNVGMLKKRGIQFSELSEELKDMVNDDTFRADIKRKEYQMRNIRAGSTPRKIRQLKLATEAVIDTVENIEKKVAKLIAPLQATERVIDAHEEAVTKLHHDKHSVRQNPWIHHVLAHKKRHGVSFKTALQDARQSYMQQKSSKKSSKKSVKKSSKKSAKKSSKKSGNAV